MEGTGLEQLAERVKRGEEGAFAELYARTSQYAFFHARSIVGNEEEAQDLVQEAYIAVYRNIGTLRENRYIKSWIGGIIFNLGNKRLRGQHEILPEEELFEQLESEDAGASPEGALDEKETASIMQEALNQLPPLQKAAVIAYYYDDRSVSDIARDFSCSEGTIKSRLNYARRTLRTHLEEEERRTGVRLHVLTGPTILWAVHMLLSRTSVPKAAEAAVWSGVESTLGLGAVGLAAGGAAAAPDLFDPMTGEPLSQAAGGSAAGASSAPDMFDPMTGEPLSQVAAEAPDLFDPETGEPLRGRAGEAPDLFDPETGEPLHGRAGEAPDLFDPETGEPLRGRAGEAPDLFDPETGRPLRGAASAASRGAARGAARSAGRAAAGAGLVKPVLIGAGALCVCAGAGTVVMVGNLMKSKQDIVTDALTEVVETVDEGFLEEEFGISGLKELLLDGSVRTGLSVEVGDLETLFGYGYGNLSTIEASAEFSRDADKNEVALDLGVGVGRMDLATLQIFMDENQLALASPELTDQMLVLEYKGNLSRAEDSYMVTYVNGNSRDLEFAEAFMTDTNRMLSGKEKRFRLGELYERYKETTKACEKLKNAMEIESIDAKKFTVNGKEQKCKGYDVTIPGEAIADFIYAAGKYITSDDAIEENEIAWMKDVLTAVRMMGGLHYYQARDWSEDQIDQLVYAAERGISWLGDAADDYLDDIEMKLYVDKKGHAVALLAETSIDLGGRDSASVEADFRFAGGAAPLRNMEGTVEVRAAGERVEISVERTEKDSDGKVRIDQSVSLRVPYGSGFSIESSLVYNRKNGNFQFALADDVDSPRILGIEIDGAVTDLKKGKSLTVEVDSVGIRSGGERWDSLSGTFFIEPLSGGVKRPSGEVFDVLDAGKRDWEQLGTELEDEIRSIMRELGQL